MIPYRQVLAAVLFGALLSPSGAASAGAAFGPCDGVDTSLTADRKQEYAGRVAAVVGKGVTPAQIEIHQYIGNGGWSAVYASTPETDDGFLFFESGQFKDVWGGAADPSDRDQLTAWAKGIGAPEALATCFAYSVTG